MYGFDLHWALTIWASAVIGCFSISAFASLVGIPIGIKNSAVGLKSLWNKNNNLIITVLLAKTKLNTVEVLISKALIYSYIKSW